MDSLRRRRNELVARSIAAKRAEEDPMAAPGKDVALACEQPDCLTTFLSMDMPAIDADDAHAAATTLEIVADTLASKMVTLVLSSSSLEYVRAAIRASGTQARARGRKRGDRVAFDVPGVHWDYRRESFYIKSVDHDGRSHMLYKKPKTDEATSDFAQAFKDEVLDRDDVHNLAPIGLNLV